MSRAVDRTNTVTGDRGSHVRLDGLRALILLGGAVRRTALNAATGRSVLDLPVGSGTTLLQHWCDLARDLVAYLEQPSLDIRLLIDRTGPCPDAPEDCGGLRLTIERDPLELRGTGGMLRDLAEEYDPDDLILVLNASKIPLTPLVDEVRELERSDAPVRIVSQRDGTPTGMMLLRCETLSRVPEVGFVDMKEQALPTIAEHVPVAVIQHDRPVGDPIRTLADYVGALRVYHRRNRSDSGRDDPFAEAWEPAFSIVEDGALVDDSAMLHDSVVLRGGEVGPGATLVRSVVCPGGRVQRGGRSIEELVMLRSEERKLMARMGGIW